MKFTWNAWLTGFSDALSQVMRESKYDRLTGRSVDFRQVITDAIERFILFILRKLGFIPIEDTEYNLNILIAVFYVITALILIIIFFILFRYLRRKKTKTHDLSGIFEELAQHAYTVEEWLALGKTHENISRRLAVRYQYIAVILSLNERVAVIHPSKTNAQILRELTVAAPGLTGDFSRTIDCFHFTWFGNKMLSDADYTRFKNSVSHLVGAYG